MSNLSVLERLEHQLSEYEDGKVPRATFLRFLTTSVEALEGIPYSVLIELRRHEQAIDMEGYCDDEGFQSNESGARQDLKVWIAKLKLEGR